MSKKPEFYVLYKEFNGKMKQREIIGDILDGILTKNGKISKRNFCIYDAKFNLIPVKTKKQLEEYIITELRYHYWAKCEWEYIAIDWPYRDTIDKSNPVKIDVYKQLEPNIPLIVDLVWNYIEPKLK